MPQNFVFRLHLRVPPSEIQNSTCVVANVSTEPEVFGSMASLPSLQNWFKPGKSKMHIRNRLTNGLSFFKKGISISWEDPQNKTGESLVFSDKTGKHLKAFEENFFALALFLISDCPEARNINGIKLIDKSNKMGIHHKLEFWLDRTGLYKQNNKLVDLIDHLEKTFDCKMSVVDHASSIACTTRPTTK